MISIFYKEATGVEYQLFPQSNVLFYSEHLKGEIYDGKKYPLDKNLTYFLGESTSIFLSLAIQVFF